MTPGLQAIRTRLVGAKRPLFVAGFLVLAQCTGKAEPQDSGDDDRASGSAFFAVRVGDVEAAGRWYSQVLDLREANRLEGSGFAIRLLSRPGLTVELIQRDGDASPSVPTLGLFKAGFYVPDADALYTRLRSMDVDLDDQLFVDSALNARTFVFRDPEGNRLQVFEHCGESC